MKIDFAGGSKETAAEEAATAKAAVEEATTAKAAVEEAATAKAAVEEATAADSKKQQQYLSKRANSIEPELPLRVTGCSKDVLLVVLDSEAEHLAFVICQRLDLPDTPPTCSSNQLNSTSSQLYSSNNQL